MQIERNPAAWCCGIFFWYLGNCVYSDVVGKGGRTKKYQHIYSMKYLRIGLLSISLLFTKATYAQIIKNDSTNYIYYTDKLGNQKKALVAQPKHILIVDGDSIYTVSNEFQLRRLLEKQRGFNIINNPDSTTLFLQERIKAIVIIKNER